MKKRIGMIMALLSLLTPMLGLAQSESRLLRPPALKAGDTVALVASAWRTPDTTAIEEATARLKVLGLKVKYGHSLFKQNAYFAGTDRERAADLNAMFKDPEVNGILELRGGWGTNRILEYLDYEAIGQHPKILMGFSDITSLLLGIYAKTGLITFHGTIGAYPWPAFTVDSLKRVLFSAETVQFQNPIQLPELETDIIQTENRIQTIRGGKAKGRLLGGNLSVLTAMLDSPYLPSLKGAILFVENIGVQYYQIDRMMSQLQKAGILKEIKGFVFGQCTDCEASSESVGMLGSQSLRQILDHYIKPLNIPAWSGAMIGHNPKMFTLPEGIPVEIDADKGTITLLEPATVKSPTLRTGS
jgi:muramoyltetrapeptide carboxypeptidase